MRKPRVIHRCVANNYAMHDERIIEVSDGYGNGALISVRKVDKGVMVQVYRRTNCEVIVGKEGD